MTRRGKRRALSVFRSFSVLFGAATLLAIGCTGSLIAPPPQCTGPHCSCDQDPLQPLCKGFNDRPDGGMLDVTDAAKVDATNDGSLTPDTSTTPDAASDASDASADAAADGG